MTASVVCHATQRPVCEIAGEQHACHMRCKYTMNLNFATCTHSPAHGCTACHVTFAHVLDESGLPDCTRWHSCPWALVLIWSYYQLQRDCCAGCQQRQHDQTQTPTGPNENACAAGSAECRPCSRLQEKKKRVRRDAHTQQLRAINTEEELKTLEAGPSESDV